MIIQKNGGYWFVANGQEYGPFYNYSQAEEALRRYALGN